MGKAREMILTVDGEYILVSLAPLKRDWEDVTELLFNRSSCRIRRIDRSDFGNVVIITSLAFYELERALAVKFAFRRISIPPSLFSQFLADFQFSFLDRSVHYTE